MKKTLIIFTGGTISMKIDPKSQVAVPGVSIDKILDGIKNIEKYGDIEIYKFGDYPGPHINDELLFSLYKVIKRTLDDDRYDSVIVTHGTDTLEESAYFIDLLVDSSKPVIFVGAMRNASEMGYDGPNNIASAIVCAKSLESKNRGVLIVINNQINAASETTKSNTLSLDTFKSLEFGPLGIIDNNEAIYFRTTTPTSTLKVDKLIDNVFLIKAYMSMDSTILDCLIDNNAKGIVIEAMGRGNVPPSLLDSIKRAIDKGIIIVVISRCPTGRVLDTYGYSGGGKNLTDIGVIFGNNINGQKMRIKLTLALSSTNDYKKIVNIIKRDDFNA